MAIRLWPRTPRDCTSRHSRVQIGGSARPAARTSDYGRIVTQGWGQVNVTGAISRSCVGTGSGCRVCRFSALLARLRRLRLGKNAFWYFGGPNPYSFEAVYRSAESVWRTRSSLRDLNHLFHFSQRWRAGLSWFVPPGLDSRALHSTASPENQFSRTH